MKNEIKKTINKIIKTDKLYKYKNRVNFKCEIRKKRLHFEDNRFKPEEPIGGYPLVSIIVMNRNNHDTSNQFLEFIKDKKCYGNYEIVQGDTKGNLAQCNNEAVQFAKGDYLLFLNHVTEVTDGWLDALLKVAYDNPDVGVVGSKIIYSSEAGDKAFQTYHTGMVFRSQKQGKQYWIKPVRLTRERMNASIYECAAVTGECMLVKRSAFEQVGGFDTLYENGYEDVDLCLKMIQAGYHNYYCGESLVLYKGVNLDNTAENKKQEAYNREIYKGRWQTYILQQMLEEKKNGNAIYTDQNVTVEELTNIYGVVGPLQEKEIDICGAMPQDDTKKFWGDYHYAMAMKREFEKLGYRVNVRSKEHWYDLSTAKYVVVLRGVKAYYPGVATGQKYIMWNISHPAETDIREYDLYDYVFFASQIMKERYEQMIHVPCGVLMQCTDPQIMHCKEEVQKEYELLFVGNSRRVYRQILKDLLPTKHNLTVYGRHWEEFPVQDYVVADYIANEEVGQAYHDAKILLNDHWEDMREYGIISNRIFDALAVGAFIISDDVPGMKEIFRDAVVTYCDKEDLEKKIDYYLCHETERKEKAQIGKQIVLREHTFARRVEIIVNVMEQLGLHSNS